MAHMRKQIRDALVTTLTGLSTTGANVFRSRVYPLPKSKMPGLFIYTNKESSTRVSMGSRYERTVTINIEALVLATADYDDTLDQISKEIEVALHANLDLGGLVEDLRIVSFESEFSDQGEAPLARGTIEVEVDYDTENGDPETAA